MKARKAVRKTAAKLGAAAERFANHRPAIEVFRKVRAVQTRFIQLDHATRVGGLPIERVIVIHGPSSEGKTVLTLGLEGSFLALDHFAKHLDAERTTDQDWVRKLIGDQLTHRNFFACRPDTYEEAIVEVRNFATDLIAAREAGEVPPETAGIVIVDSLQKLVPANLLKEILEEDAKQSDVKIHDRMGMRQAAANTVWLRELIPLADKASLAVVLITRESEDPDADDRTRKAGYGFKVLGGKGVVYDSSLVIRPRRSSYVTTTDGEVIGEKIECTIRKTKVGEKDGRSSVFHFHTSNGLLVPYGFDRARDVVELAKRFEVVKVAGNSFMFDKRRIGVGVDNSVKRLTGEAELLAEVEAATREQFAHHAPVEDAEEAKPGAAAEHPFDKAARKREEAKP